jgi:hypothetical protein
MLKEIRSNSCPEPHVIAKDGTKWISDYVNSAGAGQAYQCIGSRKADASKPAEACQSVVSAKIWGYDTRGIDFRNYTNGTLHFIGATTSGSTVAAWYCRTDKLTQTLEFGVSSGYMRAWVDLDRKGSMSGPPGAAATSGCASASNRAGLFNAPDSTNNNNPGVNMVRCSERAWPALLWGCNRVHAAWFRWTPCAMLLATRPEPLCLSWRVSLARRCM